MFAALGVFIRNLRRATEGTTVGFFDRHEAMWSASHPVGCVDAPLPVPILAATLSAEVGSAEADTSAASSGTELRGVLASLISATLPSPRSNRSILLSVQRANQGVDLTLELSLDQLDL